MLLSSTSVWLSFISRSATEVKQKVRIGVGSDEAANASLPCVNERSRVFELGEKRNDDSVHLKNISDFLKDIFFF